MKPKKNAKNARSFGKNAPSVKKNARFFLKNVRSLKIVTWQANHLTEYTFVTTFENEWKQIKVIISCPSPVTIKGTFFMASSIRMAFCILAQKSYTTGLT